ncbi:MAG: lytic transglycosylase domain-containing protein [Alphaproteobacteria bacterium]|nr:lytic transglycosylase domain-containing protein [Alphaproteobacteria bacterium]
MSISRVAVLFFSAAFLAGLSPSFGGALNKSQQAQYKQAFKAAHKGQWKTAQRLSRTALKRNPSAPGPAQVIDWLQAQSLSSGAKFSDINKFLGQTPAWPRTKTLRRRAESAMKKDFSQNATLAWFRKYPPLTATGVIRHVDALRRAGRQSDAADAIRNAWIGFNMNRSDERQFRKRFRRDLTKLDEIKRLDRLIWDRRISAAKRQMRRVDIDHRHLSQAKIMLSRRIGGVDPAIARIPASLLNDPGLLFERMRWRRRKGFQDGAIELLAQQPDHNFRPRRWWIERASLTRHVLRKGDVTHAYRLAKNHRQTKGAAHAEAEWLSGWIALRYLRDPGVAQGHFRDPYNNVKFPVSRARGAYWAGRAAEAEGAYDDAMKWYRLAARHVTTFYGQMAYLHIPGPGNGRPPAAPAVTAQEKAQFEKRPFVKIIRSLAQLEQKKLLRPFFDQLARAVTKRSDWPLLTSLAHDIGHDNLAIRMAKQALKKGVVLVEAGYPSSPFMKGLSPNPEVIHAIIRQESAFDPKAVSPAGARGLMQLMPATARGVARSLKIRHSTRLLTADPRHNVNLGASYINGLLRDFDGSLVLALAAYNAGPHRVRRWLRENGDPRRFDMPDAIDWIEQIPFKETRNYVQRVLENLPLYHHRLRDDFSPIYAIQAIISLEEAETP